MTNCFQTKDTIVMGLVRIIFFVGMAVLAWLVAIQLNTVPPMVEIDPDPWWGPGERREQNTNIRNFKIEIPQKVRITAHIDKTFI